MISVLFTWTIVYYRPFHNSLCTVLLYDGRECWKTICNSGSKVLFKKGRWEISQYILLNPNWRINKHT